MRTFREVAGRELTWVRVDSTDRRRFLIGRRPRRFELRTGGEVVAELSFDSQRSDHARARSGDGAWRFERQGVTRPEIRIMAEPAGAGEAAPEAVLHTDRLFRPTTVAVGSQRYGWKREGLFSRWRSLADGTGPLLRVRQVGLSVTGRGVLEIRPAAFGHPDLPVLVLAGWYLFARNQGKEHG